MESATFHQRMKLINYLYLLRLLDLVMILPTEVLPPLKLGRLGLAVLPNLGPIALEPVLYLAYSKEPGFFEFTTVPAALFISLVTPLLSTCLRIFWVLCTPVGPLKNEPCRAMLFPLVA
jgi:hypothetical protein|tara:strand:+ start:932 stop:1288 length:357 start_codon:yes stop_codon:yes gene_type:complete